MAGIETVLKRFATGTACLSVLLKKTRRHRPAVCFASNTHSPSFPLATEQLAPCAPPALDRTSSGRVQTLPRKRARKGRGKNEKKGKKPFKEAIEEWECRPCGVPDVTINAGPIRGASAIVAPCSAPCPRTAVQMAQTAVEAPSVRARQTPSRARTTVIRAVPPVCPRPLLHLPASRGGCAGPRHNGYMDDRSLLLPLFFFPPLVLPTLGVCAKKRRVGAAVPPYSPTSPFGDRCSCEWFARR